MNDEIITLKEVAIYLKINEKTVYRLIAKRSFPCFKVGHSWRFRKADIDDWINKQSNN
jgi:excisionase family DNA binding protein